MKEHFDARDYASERISGESLAGLRGDRFVDAVRWPLIWLSLGAMMVAAAWGAGHLYHTIKGGSATVQHTERGTTITVNGVSAGFIHDDPISGR